MASTFNNLVGKKVYRNSSFAPTRGTNNPQGYIMRGLAQQAYQNNNNPGISPVGNDGESDSRSGLAQQALHKNLNNRTGQRTLHAEKAAPASAVLPQTASSTLSAPTVEATDEGTLRKLLPYNNDFWNKVAEAKYSMNQELASAQQARQEAMMQYALEQQLASQEYGETQRNTRNQVGLQNLLFSSGHGRAVTQDATRYTDLLNRLTQNDTQNQNAFMYAQNSAVNNYNHALAQAALALGVDLEQEAGTLGLGAK